ncbi:hypothetical protein R1sor_009704 [Riccia sorocarpa]|uniref:DNA methylase N-4/N-6 domain-containing protein n=1 Tax=Riccia sorocarpa TaxID=122646 RepID=A0ABD3HVU5_9MARC
MMTNTDSNYHSLVVVLQPRFCTKHTKEDWQDNYPPTWRFDCLGGNHSLAARYRITISHLGDYDELLQVNCIVYIGLTKHEASLIAHDDNADALIRRKYTFAQQIEYYHKQFLERGDEPTNELRRRLTIETQVIGPGQSVESKMLSTEAYFQIAFREGPLWEVQHALFEKYNKKDNSKKKGKKADGEGQITLTFFKPLVSVSDDRKLSILLRLLKGEIKLEDVKTECEACKINDIMAMCFCKQVGVSSWEEAKEKLPEYATEKRINQYHTLFKDVMKKAPNRAFLRKYCNIDDDEAGPPKKPRGPQLTPLQVIPMDFINFCARAKKYRLALERGDADPLGDEDTRFRNFKPEGAEFSTKWQIYKEDVCHLQGHIPKLDYKLAIADVPYGFNFKGCRHEDKDPFSLQNFNDMIMSFASVTESDYWTMVIFHSLQQFPDVSKALSDFGCSVVPGVWIKTNCKNAGGPRPVINQEYFSVGFWSVDGKMSMKHFGNSDSKSQPHTGIVAPAATYKVELPDGDVANVYQKSQKVITQLIEDYSKPGDWVLDLCSGSGTTLVCALLAGRNCIAVEKDERQFMFLPSRVMLVSQKKLPNADLETHMVGKHSVEVSIDPETLKAHATVLSQEPVVSHDTPQRDTREAGETSADPDAGSVQPQLLLGAPVVGETSGSAVDPAEETDPNPLAIVPARVPDSLLP